VDELVGDHYCTDDEDHEAEYKIDKDDEKLKGGVGDYRNKG